MIATLAMKLIGWGLPQRFARPVIYGTGVALFAAALWLGWTLWLGSHDRAVVRDHDAQVNVKAASDARAADARAGEERRADDARVNDEANELERTIENAPDATRPITAARRAYLRCIRLQQQARATGQPAPACDRSAVPR